MAKSKASKLKPTTAQKSSKSTKTQTTTAHATIFGRENFKWIGIGLALIALGMLLMMGGSMPSPDVWDESLIYSHRRITLAPLLIVIGLLVEVYAIFK